MFPTAFAPLVLSLLLTLPGQLAASLCPLLPGEHERFGINVSTLGGKSVDDYATAPLNLGWYIDYRSQLTPSRPQEMRYVQMISSHSNPLNTAVLYPRIDANPGAVWVLGNEPDRWLLQDSRTPAQYAEFYHHAYHIIKERDPTARIATAGIVQPTPIRLLYLDFVLAEYRQRFGRAMPVDIWTIHNFVLREVPHEWGADIPPGMGDYAHLGKRYTVFDHGRMDIFRQHIVDFRRWMAANGYRNTPLIVSEYGILLPKLYGFDAGMVRNYMLSSFDYMRTAIDPALGYPADGNRLVQAWGWFSLNEQEYDADTGFGFNGNLFDHDSGVMLALGRAFADYTAPLVDRHVDLAVALAEPVGGPFIDPNTDSSLTIAALVVNGGNQSAHGAVVSLWQGHPDAGGVKLDQQALPPLATHCAPGQTIELHWDIGDLPPGPQTYTLRVESGTGQTDRRPANNLWTGQVALLAPGQDVEQHHLPKVGYSP